MTTNLKTVALYVAPFAAAFVEAFAEAEINSASPFTTVAIQHAFMAAVLLETGLLKIQLQKWLATGTVVTAIPSPATPASVASAAAKTSALLTLALVIALAACGASSSTAAAPSTPAASAATQRAEFRAAILAADAGYKAIVPACIAAAQLANDDTIRARCATYLVPAGQAISVAAAALDTWDDASGPIVACRLQSAVVALVTVATMPLNLPPAIVAAIQDAEVLGSSLVGACPSLDAGQGE